MKQQNENFTVIEKLYSDHFRTVYRGKDNKTNATVIVKCLKTDKPDINDIVKLKREYRIADYLKSIPNVIYPVEIATIFGSIGIVFEDIGGTTLREIINNNAILLQEKIKISINLADTLEQIHKKNVIHKDIKPDNIMVNLANNIIKISDFSISTQLEQELADTVADNKLEGTPVYMSPEQTGRMNRKIDYRTDIYSLGITLYELFTNQLPFKCRDTLEYIYAHIAEEPKPPKKMVSSLPLPISEIILKCINKNAEDRYQSAFGLKKDLSYCLEALVLNGVIEDFVLGKFDYSSKFMIPQKLYGREKELEQLLGLFKQVAFFGETHFLLIKGYSGIGKSALVNEIQKEMIYQKSIYLKGKYDLIKHNIPYYGLIQAFTEFVNHILCENIDVIDQWKENIIQSLGNTAQLIANVIPALKYIIGHQADLAEINPKEAQNRFNSCFQKFVRIICTRDSPLIIFLDDLQWADLNSLKLIEYLISANIPYFFLIGAYRDNEVDSRHPLFITLEELKKNIPWVSELHLPALTADHINNLVSETLLSPKNQTRHISEVIYSKTLGNPFYANSFFGFLHKENHIFFDYQKTRWVWEINKIKSLDVTDNVVDQLAKQISKLPEEMVPLLKFAACIGHQFSLNLLCAITQRPPFEIINNLTMAINENYIFPLGNDYKLIQPSMQKIPSNIQVSYKFLHDKIQQAAYSLMPSDEQVQIHYQIATLLYKNYEEKEPRVSIFDVLNQYNLCKGIINNKSEKNFIADLNLQGAQKAFDSTAYEVSYDLAKLGLSFLGQDAWRENYQTCLDLHTFVVKNTMLLNKTEMMNTYINIVDEQANDILDKVPIYECKIASLEMQKKSLEAINYAMPVINALGISFPKKLKKIKCLQYLWHIKYLYKKEKKRILTLPDLTDKKIKAAIHILYTVYMSAYNAKPMLSLFIFLKIIQLTFKYGFSIDSVVGFSGSGYLFCHLARDYQTGYEISKIGLDFIHKKENYKTVAGFAIPYYGTVLPFVQELKLTLKPCLEAYKIGVENGDFNYASTCLYVYLYQSFFCSKDLSKLELEIRKYTNALTELGEESALYRTSIYHQTVLNLISDKLKESTLLKGEIYNEFTMQDPSNINYMFTLFYYKLFLSLVFNEYNTGFQYSKMCDLYAGGGRGKFLYPIYIFMKFIISFAIYHQLNSIQQKEIREDYRDYTVIMKEWAENAPDNYQSLYLLVLAFRQVGFKKELSALHYFEQACQSAEKGDFMIVKAICFEKLAEFYMLRDSNFIVCQAYIMTARSVYLEWGAIAKVKALEEKYPNMFIQTGLETQNKDSFSTKSLNLVTTSGTHDSELNIDMISIFKSSIAISGEIHVKRLLEKLIENIIQYSGAQKGLLALTKNESDLFVECVKDGHSEKVIVLPHIPLHQYGQASLKIIQYVFHKKEIVLLGNAQKDSPFKTDNYIMKHKIKSILCSPIIKQQKCIGVIYLENNLTESSFTKKHEHLINLFSSQAAIALDNANLYEQIMDLNQNLEKKVQEQTKELVSALKELKRTNESKSLFFAQMTHDLRTPLHVIIGIMDKISKREEIKKDPELMLGVDTALKSGERQLSLVNDILDLSKLESGKMEINDSPLDLNDLLNSIKQMIEILLQNNPVKFVLENTLQNEEVWIISDKKKLYQILMNLISNAVKFTTKGEIRLKVEIKSETPSDQLWFLISDTGIGISKENINRIFSTYTMIDSEHQKQVQGSGLGLSICKGISAAMNGDIIAESKINKGSVFKLWIPFKPTEAPIKSEIGEILIEDAKVDSKNILVVDDDDFNCTFARMILEGKYQYSIANSGYKAIDILKDNAFDLIFLDIQMPQMDGRQTLKEIRKFNQHTPIVALTAQSLKGVREELLKSGFDDYILKPFKEEDLLSYIRDYKNTKKQKE